MSFEFNLTISGIKVLKRKQAKRIHEETNAKGNIRALWGPTPENCIRVSSGAPSLHVCVYQVSQVIFLRGLRDTLEENCQDRGGDRELVQDFEDKTWEF